MSSVMDGVGLREDFSDEQILATIEDLENQLGTLESTPIPCYSTNPPSDSGCISLKALRESNVTIRRPKKKQQSRGRHVNPTLASCIPLSVRLVDPSFDSHSPSAVPGALRAMPPSSGDQ